MRASFWLGSGVVLRNKGFVTCLWAMLTTLLFAAGFKLHPEEFEKDNDENFHIDFICAFGNLRFEP